MYNKKHSKGGQTMTVNSSNINYQKEKQNYQKIRVNYQKEIITYLKNCKRRQEKQHFVKDPLDEYLESLTEMNKSMIQNAKEKDGAINQIEKQEKESRNSTIENKIEELEQLKAITFAEEFSIQSELDLFNQEQFLYHGLRFSIPEGFPQFLKD